MNNNTNILDILIDKTKKNRITWDKANHGYFFFLNNPEETMFYIAYDSNAPLNKYHLRQTTANNMFSDSDILILPINTEITNKLQELYALAKTSAENSVIEKNKDILRALESL